MKRQSKNKSHQRQYQQAGILPYFYDELGRKQVISEPVKRRILPLLAQPPQRGRILPWAKVFRQGSPAFIRLKSPQGEKHQGRWQLVLEQQVNAINGKIKNNRIQLPADLPLGYHQLTAHYGNKTEICSLIVAPQQCYLPPALQQQKKLWGLCLQLYSVRSQRNWGIGDFGDLKYCIVQLAQQGGDFIGLNPIHALFPNNPEDASPYSPSSRRWLNLLYIDVTALPAFQQSPEAQQWFNQETTQQQLSQLRQRDWIDYQGVKQLKFTALKLAFDYWQQHMNEETAQFEQFVQQGGESLAIQATFDALQEHLMQRSTDQWGWGQWDSAYQDYRSPQVQQFCQQYRNHIRFYLWLQWLAHHQLAECYQLSRQTNMPLGLYKDLAVGVSPNGAESWGNQALYSLNASIGAPPDIMAPQGQNWGLAPMQPQILQQQAYRPFIELIRTNMQHCGALRIDHIMGLLRLWWIKGRDSAAQGAYVRYPLADLLGIIALESQRQQCAVIGEDLGIVPKQIVQQLSQYRILSYKVFYFEWDNQGQSRPLKHYPYYAMTTLSTHDLPTIQGYWQGYDFSLGEKVGVYPNAKIVQKLKQQRQSAREQIWQKLAQSPYANLLSDLLKQNPQLQTGEGEIALDFVHLLQQYVSGVQSALFGMQIEDWLNMLNPVNIPGTSDSYPNWRRKLAKDIEQVFACPDIQQLLAHIEQQRNSN